MRTPARLFAALLLCTATARAQDPDAGVPLDPTLGQGAATEPPPSGDKEIAASETGEDAAPEGIVSRASGRPDHPRTLEEIVKSGYIRVLTRNNDTSFFIYRGHRMGFYYEIGKKLAQSLGIRVDMIITQSWQDMVPALLKGEGDAIAAEVTVTEARKRQVLFAAPWGHTKEMIVWKDGTTPLKSAEDLAGKEVHVRKSSSYAASLRELNEKLHAAGKPEAILTPVGEDWETDTILEAVSRGEIV